MGVSVTDLTTLDQTVVDQFDAQLVSMIQGYDPTVEVRDGVLHDLLVRLHAVLDAATQTNIDRIRQANSLKAINANPALADNDIVDACLSNYNLTRNPGVKATGRVTVTLDAQVGVVVPSSTTFTFGGRVCRPVRSYAARTSASSILTDQDVLLTPVGANYAFDIEVQDTAVGTAGNIARGTLAVVDPQPAHFVKANAKDDFAGGVDAETTQSLLTKLAAGMAVEAWSGRTTIESLLRKQAAFQNVRALSVIGFGDVEMLRDQHQIWPGSTGGRVDLYLRSQALYQTKSLDVEATLISKVGGLGTWQFGLDLDAAPGFYEVAKVLLPTIDPAATGFAITSDVRSLDLVSPPSDTVPPPDLVTAVEGVYSRFQAAVLQFADNATDATSLAIGATKSYVAVTRVMPLVAEVQTFLDNPDRRPPASDVLVKAPIPCFVGVTATIEYDAAGATPDETTVQQAVADSINSLGFTGRLSRSLVEQAIRAVVPNLLAVTAFGLTGRLRKPNGTTTSLSDNQQLVIATDAPSMVSARSVNFYSEAGDVDLTFSGISV
jgi:hypothetical protein